MSKMMALKTVIDHGWLAAEAIPYSLIAHAARVAAFGPNRRQPTCPTRDEFALV
jgi:hypothetical protein